MKKAWDTILWERIEKDLNKHMSKLQGYTTFSFSGTQKVYLEKDEAANFIWIFLKKFYEKNKLTSLVKSLEVKEI